MVPGADSSGGDVAYRCPPVLATAGFTLTATNALLQQHLEPAAAVPGLIVGL
jgi:hypothetical protein